MRFVSLHSHTTFSFQDAFGTPKEYFERAAELGMSVLGITDHGNSSSHVQSEKAALKTGVKAIFGLEAYTALGPKEARKFHITILAMNQQGLSNLYQIVTESWEEFYRWPTVTGGMFARNQEGLIVLSGCADSLLACSLLGGKSILPQDASWARAYRLAGTMKDLLGDRYYLECQIFPELDRCKQLNQVYEKLGYELNIPLVATADVHTLLPGQENIRALLHGAGRGENAISQQMGDWEYSVPSHLPESDAYVRDRLERTGLSHRVATEAWINTGVIASRCNVVLPKAEMFTYPVTPGEEKWPENDS